MISIGVVIPTHIVYRMSRNLTHTLTWRPSSSQRSPPQLQSQIVITIHKNFTCDIQYADEITWSLKNELLHIISAMLNFHAKPKRSAEMDSMSSSMRARVHADHMVNTSVRRRYIIYHNGRMKLKVSSAFCSYFTTFLRAFTWKTNYIKLWENNDHSA